MKSKDEIFLATLEGDPYPPFRGTYEVVPSTPAKMSAMCEYSLFSRSITLISGLSVNPMILSILTSSGSLSMNIEKPSMRTILKASSVYVFFSFACQDSLAVFRVIDGISNPKANG